MNKEKKTIIIGISITMLILLLAFLILFLIYKVEDKDNKNNNSNSTIRNEENLNNNINTNDDTNQSTSTKNENESNPSTPINNNTEKTVTVYLFRGNGCPHCENAIKFLESIANDYSYLKIISYEVWNNKENQELMEEVSKELGIEFTTSVPFIVIGNTYAKKGFADGMSDGIIKEIESSYENKDYIDVIEKVLDSNNINVSPEKIN